MGYPTKQNCTLSRKKSTHLQHYQNPPSQCPRHRTRCQRAAPTAAASRRLSSEPYSQESPSSARRGHRRDPPAATRQPEHGASAKADQDGSGQSPPPRPPRTPRTGRKSASSHTAASTPSGTRRAHIHGSRGEQRPAPQKHRQHLPTRVERPPFLGGAAVSTDKLRPNAGTMVGVDGMEANECVWSSTTSTNSLSSESGTSPDAVSGTTACDGNTPERVRQASGNQRAPTRP